MTSLIRIQKDGSGAKGLNPCSIVPADAILTGAVNESGEIHFEMADDKLSIGTWESTPLC